MERTKILNVIQELLAEIIDNKDLSLDESSSPSTVDDWDSLAHFQLVMELQKEFVIKFTASDIQSWKNVGNIISCIASKL